jgi:hypothetical protein
MAPGGNGDLQRATMNDSGRDEITCVRRIDNIDPNGVPTSSSAHRQVHSALTGGPNDQGAAQHVIGMKWAGLMLNDPLADEGREGLGKPGADDDDQRSCLKQPLNLPGGDGAAADHQTSLAL